MTGRLDGKVAIVIGAARRIGAAIAERLVEEGARVTIADTLKDEGRATAARLSQQGEALFVPTEVSDQTSVDALVQTTVERCGRLDIMIQNAGIYPLTLLPDITVAEWDQVLAVNLRGCFLAIRAATAPMRAQRYGRIVLTSSITGPRVSSPGHGHYSASKAGINGLIRAAAIEQAPFCITVNGVEPGNIVTPALTGHRSKEYADAMTRSVPLGRLGTPREVAHAVLFLASDEAAYITGTTIVVDGGQILPEAKL
ncbi:MAG TPA: SDR family NAD(P)-dependent oxidoreductase [Geminicoccaceae bacterium]|nr:SDR family NAD(P)-dependent oxidoreductase [Geminicoccaceae bacterium]